MPADVAFVQMYRIPKKTIACAVERPRRVEGLAVRATVQYRAARNKLVSLQGRSRDYVRLFCIL